MRHGTKVKTCSHEGCTNQARNGGVCIRHGAKQNKRKTCSHDIQKIHKELCETYKKLCETYKKLCKFGNLAK